MNKKVIYSLIFLGIFGGCASKTEHTPPTLPSLAYSQWAKDQEAGQVIMRQNEMKVAEVREASLNSAARAQLRLVNDSLEKDTAPLAFNDTEDSDFITNEGMNLPSDVEMRANTTSQTRPYRGPLSLGNPGISSSLWQESQRGAELLRDDRAWQPLDLITIIVTESAEGAKEGDTEVKSKSSVAAKVGEWLGIIDSIKKRNSQISDDDGTLVSASTQNDYKGEGETTRKDTLKAKISAMVVEVLPGNILRIEGEKIIALNQEEQTIAISGLVRPKDINSANEVDSSKIANLRIDYYGRGVVSEAQYGGWFTRLMRVLWPF